jgi:hypothetical protein
MLSYFWKVYAWIIVCLYAVSLLGIDWFDRWAVTRLVIDLIGVIGLFGFVYHRQIGSVAVWRCWLVLNVLVEVWSILAGRTSTGWSLLVEIVVILPLYVAMIRYAFPSLHLSRGRA